MMNATGVLYGVGLGPGDPELLTVKAVNTIQSSQVIVYLTNEQGQSYARRTASSWIRAEQEEMPVFMPMDRQRQRAIQVYDELSIQLADKLSQGKKISVLCEGDPFFYGSFIYIYERLNQTFRCQVIPGISALQAVSAMAQTPLTRLDANMVVVTAGESDENLKSVFQQHDCVVILKVSSQLQRIITLVRQSGRLTDGIYAEYLTQDKQQLYHDLNQVTNEKAPYFSLILLAAKR